MFRLISDTRQLLGDDDENQQLIRAMTEEGMYEYNQAILEELESNPGLFEEIELTLELQRHLQFWLKNTTACFKNALTCVCHMLEWKMGALSKWSG